MGLAGSGSAELWTLTPVDRGVLAMGLSEIERSLEDVWRSLVGYDRLDLLEICSPAGSTLSAEVIGRGGTAERLGPHCGVDLATPLGLQKVLETVRARRPRHVWFAIPCDPWSTWQYLNQRSDGQSVNLQARRRRGRRMFANQEVIIKEVLSLGGEVHDEHPYVLRHLMERTREDAPRGTAAVGWTAAP